MRWHGDSGGLATEARQRTSSGISEQDMDEDIPESMGSAVRELRRATALLMQRETARSGASLEALQRASRSRVSADSQFFQDPLQAI